MLNDTEGLLLNGFTTQINLWEERDTLYAWWNWKLIPVEVKGTSTPPQPPSGEPGPSSLPSYREDTSGQFSTSNQHAESERDGLGTIVSEVTVTTTTTHKRYRVEGA